jgi:hypothetical protein
MVTYKERLKILSSTALLKKYKALYSIPTAESCIDFINRFCYTYDPRLEDEKVIPFVLYERQEELVRWLWYRLIKKENGIIDKARDLGASWSFVAFSVWLLLFQRDYSVGFYTYKERECDYKGDLSTLFGKARFILTHLPIMFRRQIIDKYMYIRNEETGTDIAGASGDNPGRSGRRTVFYKDESAFYQRPELIEAALSETSDCIIDISTHSGLDTLFYKKIEAGKTNTFTLNWYDNPNHTQEWYDKKKAKAIAEGLLHIFKREIERDPYGSIDAIIMPVSWLNMCVENTDYETGKIVAGLDVADEGKDTNALAITVGNNLVHLDEWGEGDTGKTADRAIWKAVEYKCNEFRYDATGVGAGIKARARQIKEENPDNEILNKMKIVGWNAGGAVKRPDEEDYGDLKNKDMFENAKAQAYWLVRDYVYNTYKKMIGEKYDSTKIISFNGIKNNSKRLKLIGEMSQVQKRQSSKGKVMIEKKPKGKKSPNLCEAYILTQCEIEQEWLSWTVI